MKFATASHSPPPTTPTSPNNTSQYASFSPPASSSPLPSPSPYGSFSLDALPPTPSSPLASLIPTFLRRPAGTPSRLQRASRSRSSSVVTYSGGATFPPLPPTNASHYPAEISPSASAEALGLLDDDPFACASPPSTPATSTWSPASASRYAFEASSSTGHCHPIIGGSMSVPVSPNSKAVIDHDHEEIDPIASNSVATAEGDDSGVNITPLRRRNRARTTLNGHPRNQPWHSERPVVRKRPSLPSLSILAQQNVVVPTPKSSRARHFPSEPWDKDPTELEANLPKLSPAKAIPSTSVAAPAASGAGAGAAHGPLAAKLETQMAVDMGSVQTPQTIAEEEEEDDLHPDVFDGYRRGRNALEVEHASTPISVPEEGKAIGPSTNPVVEEAPTTEPEGSPIVSPPGELLSDAESASSTLTPVFSTPTAPVEVEDVVDDVSSASPAAPPPSPAGTTGLDAIVHNGSDVSLPDMDKPLPDVPVGERPLMLLDVPTVGDVPRKSLTASVAIAISHHGDMTFPSSYPPPTQFSTSPAPSSCLLPSPHSEASALPELVMMRPRSSDDTIMSNTTATSTSEDECETSEDCHPSASVVVNNAGMYSSFWSAAWEGVAGGESPLMSPKTTRYAKQRRDEEQAEEQANQQQREADEGKFLTPSKRALSLSALFGGGAALASASANVMPERYTLSSGMRSHSYSHAGNGGGNKNSSRQLGGGGHDRSSRQSGGSGAGGGSKRTGGAGGTSGGSGGDPPRDNNGGGPWRTPASFLRSRFNNSDEEEEENDADDADAEVLGQPRLRVPGLASRERSSNATGVKTMPPVPPLPNQYKPLTSVPSPRGSRAATSPIARQTQSVSHTHSRSHSGQAMTNYTIQSTATPKSSSAVRPSTSPSTATASPTHSSPRTDSDDVPLATRIPSALVAQKSIRKQVRDERIRSRKISEPARPSRGVSGAAIGVVPEELATKLQLLQVGGSAERRVSPSLEAAAVARRSEQVTTSDQPQARSLRPTRSLHRLGTTSNIHPPLHLHEAPPSPSLVSSFQARTRRDQSLGPRNERPPPLDLHAVAAGSKSRSQSRPQSPDRAGHDQHHLVPPMPRSPLLPGASASAPMSRETSNDGRSSRPITVGNSAVAGSGGMRRARTTMEGYKQVLEETVPLSRLAASLGSSTSSPSPRGQQPPSSPLSPTFASSPMAGRSSESSATPAVVQSHQQRIFVIDAQRFITMDISASTRAEDVLEFAAAKGEISDSRAGWMLWEVANEFGMERPIRDFEMLSDVFSSWNRETRVNVLMIKQTVPSLTTALSRGAIPSWSPTHGGYVYWEAKRGKWSKRWLELREHSLYLGKKESTKDGAFICTLSTFDAYLVKRIHKSPKTFVFAVKSMDNIALFENPADCVHVFSCDQEEGNMWFEKLLVARSYVLHRERNILFRSQPVVGAPSAGGLGSSTRRTPSKPLLTDVSPSLGQQGFQQQIHTRPEDTSIFAAGSLLATRAPNTSTS